MTSQQHADEILAYWQKHRDNPHGDIGNMTFGVWANVKDLYDIWMENPLRRTEFQKRELDDLCEASLALTTLLREIANYNRGAA